MTSAGVADPAVMPGFCVGAGDPNPGPPAAFRTFLPMEPFLQPLEYPWGLCGPEMEKSDPYGGGSYVPSLYPGLGPAGRE